MHLKSFFGRPGPGNPAADATERPLVYQRPGIQPAKLNSFPINIMKLPASAAIDRAVGAHLT